ncbi:MAG: HlyD family type I secretion periplasmic adaptor subunit, partial [Sulfurimonas sp.]|nr:HlyD family type I secretion periplasmic adaptor subunit [Sulfurimonas sp.]
MSQEEKSNTLDYANEEAKKLSKELKRSKLDVHDLKYMSSLSEAVLQKSPKKSKYILWLVAFALGWLIFWA